MARQKITVKGRGSAAIAWFDQREMHDVFVVISEDGDREHIARTVYAASEDDARQTHHENYADEPIVAVHQ